MARVLKTKRFSRDARKAGIEDETLRVAAAEIEAGQADDLDGGVYKKRLNRNEHRAIVLVNIGDHLIYQYLFAKKDQSNIRPDELEGLRNSPRSTAGHSTKR